MTKAPCVNCERKGCGAYHDQCELYLQFRAEQQAISEKKIKAKEERSFVYKQIEKTKRRFNKNKRRK